MLQIKSGNVARWGGGLARSGSSRNSLPQHPRPAGDLCHSATYQLPVSARDCPPGQDWVAQYHPLLLPLIFMAPHFKRQNRWSVLPYKIVWKEVCDWERLHRATFWRDILGHHFPTHLHSLPLLLLRPHFLKWRENSGDLIAVGESVKDLCLGPTRERWKQQQELVASERWVVVAWADPGEGMAMQVCFLWELVFRL